MDSLYHSEISNEAYNTLALRGVHYDVRRVAIPSTRYEVAEGRETQSVIRCPPPPVAATTGEGPPFSHLRNIRPIGVVAI